MKIVTIFSTAVLAMTAFAGHAADKQSIVKAPVLMTDAQMKEVVGAGSPGYGLCTATGFARHGLGAHGAVNNWTYDPVSTHQVGKTNGNGAQPGFGLQTAGKGSAGCIEGPGEGG